MRMPVSTDKSIVKCSTGDCKVSVAVHCYIRVMLLDVQDCRLCLRSTDLYLFSILQLLEHDHLLAHSRLLLICCSAHTCDAIQ